MSGIRSKGVGGPIPDIPDPIHHTDHIGYGTPMPPTYGIADMVPPPVMETIGDYEQSEYDGGGKTSYGISGTCSTTPSAGSPPAPLP